MAKAQSKLTQKYVPTDRERAAINIVRNERQFWELATVFITENIAFRMRDLIRICRKNYWGTFDDPYDPITGREKIWYPLTEMFVEAVVKNIDLDTKDVRFRAKTPAGYGMTDIVRGYVREKLETLDFGDKIDTLAHNLAIDGTEVWKTWEQNGEIHTERVDLLNIFIDPSANSIQEAYRFTERSLQDPEQLQGMTGWSNLQWIRPVRGLPRTDPQYSQNYKNSNVKEIDVYEMWGKIPRWLIYDDAEGVVDGENTNDYESTQEIDGHIVVSGIDSPGREVVHLLEENTKKDSMGRPKKPYEEARYSRISGRWYGRGIAEKLIAMQLYANLNLNIRINRAQIAQMGLFKIRKGAGITPQTLSRLGSNGAILLTNMDDIEQFEIQEAGPSSYNDENVIKDITQRLTSAFDIAVGDNLPASTPATNATIQDRAARNAFSIVKDSTGTFIKRWMDRHVVPIIAKQVKVKDIIRLIGDGDEFKEVIERVVAYHAMDELEKAESRGYIPTELELQRSMQDAEQKIRRGKSMFIEVVEDIIAEECDTEIYVTNEELDIGVTTTNLINMMQIAPEYKEPITRELFDLMGLPMPRLPANAPQPQQPQQAPQAPQGGGGFNPQNPAQVVTAGNVQ